MTAIKDLVVGDLSHELDNARRLLEAIPDEHFDWKPHAKSWPIGGLANHVANLPTWQTMVLSQPGLDLATLPPGPEPASSVSIILARFDTNRAALDAVVAGADDASFADTWTLSFGDHVLLEGPRATVLRRVGISHMAHHCGQISVCLRLLDVPVPQTYGPTADHPGGF